MMTASIQGNRSSHPDEKARLPWMQYVEAQARKKTKREETEKALFDAMQMGRSQDWEGLLEIGLTHPALMDRLCQSFYHQLPDEYKYFLPVRWFLAGGKCVDSVVDAVKVANQYKPDGWIGAELFQTKKGIDVFIGTRCHAGEVSRILEWTRNYNSAYIQAERIQGKVFRGYLDLSDVIAVDADSVNGVIQYCSVIGISQVFPKIPLHTTFS